MLPAVTTSTLEALTPVSSPRPSRIRRRIRSPRLLRKTRRTVTLGESATVLRTAWVYSPFGHNFVKTMLRLAADRDELNVVGDQLGNPTSALDLADAIFRIGGNLAHSDDPALRSVFHLAARGDTNWADFARHIFAESAKRNGPTATVNSITTADYPTPARRPANSRLDSGRIGSVHGVQLPPWQASIGEVVGRILSGDTESGSGR